MNPFLYTKVTTTLQLTDEAGYGTMASVKP
jgi:hypothetical protein